MRKVVIIWLLMLLAKAGLCQSESYTIRNYKAIDGLPQSQVNIMLEDNNGYLWVGTEGGGLGRFDGREFKVYTTLDGLLSNIITFLKMDNQQNLWIFHPRGITKFDGVSFKRFNQPGSPSSAKKIRRAFSIKDTIFVVTAPGNIGKIYKDSVYYWAKPVKENVLLSYCYLAADKSVLLYLSDSTFYVRSENENFEFTHAKRFNRLQGLIFNYKNKVWVRTDSGYFTIDYKKKDFIRQQLPIKDFIVSYDSLNDVFWARSGSNLLKEKITRDGVIIDTVLSDINIRQILVDSEGNTWFATDGSGLYKYFIQDFKRCSDEEIKGVMAIHVDKEGSKWIGSMTKGLWRIKKGKTTSYADKEELYHNMIGTIAESSKGEIWVGTAYGLGKYNSQKDNFTWYSRDDGLSNASIFQLQFDDKDGLWIATQGGGVNYYDGKKFKSYSTKEGLSTNAISSLHYSRHYKKLYVGNEFGVSTIAGSHIEHLPIGGIENTSIISINAYRDSLLLFGSAGAGVVIYNPRTRFKKLITTHHGLMSDFIYFAASDEDDYIWLGSEKGITRLKLSNDFDIVESRHFDYDNGLTGVETNQNAFYMKGDRKYFGLIDGLYEYNDLEREKTKSFDLHLTDIEILYGQFSPRDHADSLWGFFKIPLNAQLPPDENHITFHFNRVDKRYPKSVKFKYFLENFDQTWSQPSSMNNVTYSNLPPGDYIFRVASTNNEGSWAPDQIRYAFTVRAPFYQSASFILGMFILIVGAVTLFFYLRVKQRINKVMMLERIRVKEQETLRKEIARDFHDEMGNQLTRIINYVSLLKLNGNGNGNGNGNVITNAAHNDLYSKVEDSAKYLYAGTRDFIWSIDPVNDELSKLFLHIRDFGEKLFEEKQIQFRAFNEVKEKTKLPYGFSREANLIFKEAMTNAFKYSNAKNVTLSLNRVDEDGFEMIFEDDGIGFYTGDVQKSNGLKNIRERSDRIHAILRIQSIKNHGTKIVLNFKLNKTLKYGLAL
jgi:ligand-binding sensor domain-containing protein/signal transduction histidine kinase